MALENKKTAAQENGVVESFEVSNVRENKYGVYFSLKLNGVVINNCKIVNGKNGYFISLPQYKGTDDKYYNTVYFRFSQADADKIMDAVESALNAKA